MSYIGNKPATNFETVQKQISTSNSGTTITLDRAVTSVQDILLTIDAVVQSYDNYSVSGTTLTVGGTLSNNRVEILYVGRTMQSVDPTDDSVSASKIKTDAVTTAKIQNDAVTKDKTNFVSTSSSSGLQIKGDGTTDGTLQLNCSQNSHGVKIKSPAHSAGQSYTLTLPTTSPSADKFIKTDGSGNLSFAEAGGGAWQLIYSDNVSGMGSGSNAYSNSALFSSDYNFYRVYILNWEPQNDSIDMELQFTLGGSLRTSNYRFHLRRHESDSAEKTGAYNNSGGSIRIFEGCGNGTSENMSGFFEYQNPTGDNGNYYCTTSMYSGIESNGYTIGGIGQGSCSDSTGAMTGFTLKAHSGGLGNYNLRAYGLKQS